MQKQDIASSKRRFYNGRIITTIYPNEGIILHSSKQRHLKQLHDNIFQVTPKT